MGEPKDQNREEVVEFLNGVDNEGRKQDCFKLLELFEQWTNEPPKIWGKSMVGFGSYHYKYESGREGDWFLTGFSPRKKDLTIYIVAGFGKYADLMENLGKYKTGASCLYVKSLANIGMKQLKNLVVQSVADMKKRYDS